MLFMRNQIDMTKTREIINKSYNEVCSTISFPTFIGPQILEKLVEVGA